METDRKRYFEMLAVLVTGGLKFILMDWLGYRVLYISLITLFWSVYVYNRHRKDPTILRKWGFRKDNFRPSVLFLLPFAVLISTGILLYGFLQRVEIPYGHVIPVFILYPAWGLIQQFMLVGLLAGNLKSLKKVRFRNYQIVLMISLLFSIVHYPDLFLMTFTFFMEMIFIIGYLKSENLWSLGLYHGVIACLLLFFALGRDPWNELWPVF